MSSKSLRSMLLLLMLALASLTGAVAAEASRDSEIHQHHESSGIPVIAVNDDDLREVELNPPTHVRTTNPNSTCAELVSEPQVLNPEFVR